MNGSDSEEGVTLLAKSPKKLPDVERPEFFVFPTQAYNVFVDRWIGLLDANTKSKLVKGPFQLYWTETMNAGEEVKSSQAFGRLEGAKAMFVEL